MCAGRVMRSDGKVAMLLRSIAARRSVVVAVVADDKTRRRSLVLSKNADPAAAAAAAASCLLPRLCRCRCRRFSVAPSSGVRRRVRERKSGMAPSCLSRRESGKKQEQRRISIFRPRQEKRAHREIQNLHPSLGENCCASLSGSGLEQEREDCGSSSSSLPPAAAVAGCSV